jgi:hypothetical protein
MQAKQQAMEPEHELPQCTDSRFILLLLLLLLLLPDDLKTLDPQGRGLAALVAAAAAGEKPRLFIIDYW